MKSRWSKVLVATDVASNGVVAGRDTSFKSAAFFRAGGGAGGKTEPRRDAYQALLELFIDVARRKAESVRQLRLLVDGMLALLDCKFGWLFVADEYLPGRTPVITHQVLTGIIHPTWSKFITEFTTHFPPEADVYAVAVLLCDDPIQIHTGRQLLATDAQREKFRDIVAFMKKLEVGDGLLACYRSGPDGARLAGFCLQRDQAKPDLSSAELDVARRAILGMIEMEKQGHLVFRDQPEAELAPRLHQVLDRLLTGKSPKQIAGELHLSVHTVREHVTRLYQRYGVTNREDLTAKFVR